MAKVKFLGYRAPSQISGKPKGRSILCFIEFYKWKRSGGLNIYSSNVREKYFECMRCGKTKQFMNQKRITLCENKVLLAHPEK